MVAPEALMQLTAVAATSRPRTHLVSDSAVATDFPLPADPGHGSGFPGTAECDGHGKSTW
jgi:hypothetical protein